MDTIFDQTTKTGDIVARFPRASRLLKEYRIDFCCGGNRPIAEAIKEQNLNAEEVLSKINALYQETKELNEKETNWNEASYSRLIDYVVQTHHAYLFEVLPELSGFVTKVYRVHGTHHPELAKVHQLFHQLKAELEHHLIQEEEQIFPKIKSYEETKSEAHLAEAVKAIDVLEQEHEACGNILKELRKATNDYSLPEGACTTYTLTYLKLDELETDIFQHIHLENNILFPRLEAEAKQ
ncbi:MULTISPECIES: iron-sulfur cluster repair di-iron protein [Bacillus]|uniref:Iron-sulfur cluster repair di-iron protein n=1 Tax=Bacillus glycinifermentans TaxID=1664069 RepID=A0AAJ3YYP8_9BACI|nr:MULTISPECIES: iron-sulfur cluster repair di-iron protein [Bacillus]KKB73106.1 ScdA [Bacillus sp. TH008]MBU8785170.1 iron-sulfur cluster repair di-iron protein [Bacillus glycinifermentans]MDU0071381.1 iron-sulfur cluster repair di-iron protein [Bacillus sp. IG6]MED8019318.1 iron-sulfur cluster repair di-iron protein [Bacillus glycinifermentans]NUJ15340.1 iron-sulfur cluster repair di-iron protein [Bacillus glycinifermentans]